MIIECIAIIIVIIALSMIFLRSGKRTHALCVLPLTIVPLLHIAGVFSAPGIDGLWGMDIYTVQNIFTATALVVSGVALGIMSGFFPSKKIRLIYIVTCGLYTLILASILIFNSSVA